MDISKIFTALCGLTLAVCLTLSITALTVLRTAVKENDATQQKADALADELRECVEMLHKEQDGTESLPTSAVPKDEDQKAVTFILREAGGKLGIYTDDGYLIRLTDVQIDLLPEQDRQRLRDGIRAESWKDIINLLQDYGV